MASYRDELYRKEDFGQAGNSVLAKSGIEVDDSEASVILDFLYLMAKNYGKNEEVENAYNPKEKSNSLKSI